MNENVLLKEGGYMFYFRCGLYMVGLLIFSYGISVTIKVQHLGLAPWDVLNVGLYEKLGFSIGTWTIAISVLLICVSFILDKSYIKAGTFVNAFAVGAFVDFYLWLDFLPPTTYAWPDVFTILLGIVLMGFGGGVYNAAHLGAGPRDGFMLSISDKSGISIGKVRIMTESSVLIFGLLLGGPVFVITFIFTFIQSPLFQFSYLSFSKLVDQLTIKNNENKKLARHTG
ncbi:YczE/YyaS/YitT family protein [Virgibacillus sp. W0430]|uniref:YczE/YyaS/YitT family protein n=1 Tax=Virgibacillus sp. W0430 TaxID=3391580 RepID=UPI003F459397